jgi:hypothetical protein
VSEDRKARVLALGARVSGLLYLPQYTGLGAAGSAPVYRRGRGGSQKVLGREYLARFQQRIATPASPNAAIMYGDSITIGYVGAQVATYLGLVPAITAVTNNGIAGTQIEDWRTGTGTYAASGKALSDLISAAPALAYIAFGINTPYYGGTAASFAASLEAALITLRASLDVTRTSVFVCLPLPARDGGAMSVEGGSKRDEKFVYELRHLVEPFVERYSICVYDPSFDTPDANFDSTGTNTYIWMNSDHVHPQTPNQIYHAGQIFDILVPPILRRSATTATPTAGYTVPGSEYMRFVNHCGFVIADGYLSKTTPAIIAANAQIATVPVGCRPTITLWWVNIVIWDGTNWERVQGTVLTNGQVKLVAASTLSAQRVYIDGTWNTV